MSAQVVGKELCLYIAIVVQRSCYDSLQTGFRNGELHIWGQALKCKFWIWKDMDSAHVGYMWGRRESSISGERASLCQAEAKSQGLWLDHSETVAMERPFLCRFWDLVSLTS